MRQLINVIALSITEGQLTLGVRATDKLIS